MMDHKIDYQSMTADIQRPLVALSPECHDNDHGACYTDGCQCSCHDLAD